MDDEGGGEEFLEGYDEDIVDQQYEGEYDESGQV